MANELCCGDGYVGIGFRVGDKEEYKCVEENSDEAMEYNAAQLVYKLEALLNDIDKSMK